MNNTQRHKTNPFVHGRLSKPHRFVKIYVDNIHLTFLLSQTGLKAFNILLWSMLHDEKTHQNSNTIKINQWTLEEFMIKFPEFEISKATFYRGLTELQELHIIAKSMKIGTYFINTNVIAIGID